ncbi:MAG: DUF2339 domain-containing protein [Candidatus Omnitrophica bacterium]|nr:DUF2339 domain-containing protein [Candidatus Omnitrophota bacterium]
MFNLIVFTIISIVLWNKMRDSLAQTKNDLSKDMQRSLDLIRLKLEEISNQITSEKSKDSSPLTTMSDSHKQAVCAKTYASKIAAEPVKKQELPPERDIFNSMPLKAPALKVDRQKSKLEEGISDILKKIWNWILVGEDRRQKNVSIEYAIASTWLMRLGVIAIVICIGYFLKWSIDKGLLGPTGRIALSIIAGLSMLGLGIKNLNKKYDILGQGFLGGGLAALYFSMYAAGPLYDKIPLSGTFAMMILITIVAGLMSYKFNSQLVAIFGIIGGFCTPIILSMPGVSPVGLYAYILILNLGILTIAHARNWRLLNYLGFIFTWALVFFSFSGYQVKRDFNGTITLITLLFVLQGMIVYYYNLVKQKKSSSLEITHMLFNSLFYAVIAYALILEAYGRPWPAVMAIGVAIFYIAHIYCFLKSRSVDRNLLICLIGVAGFFTVWAVPLITQKETIAICWALQAFFFLWIGLKLNSNLLINLAHILYLLVMGRLVFIDMPSKFSGYALAALPLREYWAIFLDRIWSFGVVIASFFSGFFLHKRKINQLAEFTVEEKSNSKLLVSPIVSREVMFWSGVGFMFFILYLEFFQMFAYCLSLRMPGLTLLCCILGAYVLYNYFSTNKNVFLSAAIILIVIILAKLFFCDYSGWMSNVDVYIYKKGSLPIIIRLFDYGVVFLYAMGIVQLISNKHDLMIYRKIFTVISTALLFVYISLEVNTFFYWYLRSFQEGAISVVWALFAVTYLIIGIVKSSKAWRYSGLALFVIVAGKIFFYDLADMEVIYRVIAFMLLGLISIGGSFAYIYANKKFAIEEKNEENN